MTEFYNITEIRELAEKHERSTKQGSIPNGELQDRLDEIANMVRYEGAFVDGNPDEARRLLIGFGADNFTAWHLGNY